jgi:alkylation response protein AidB-like acyl-CoA dehydrogenase
VLVEEILAAGAPVAAHWIADRQSGPLINKFGTEAQKDFYLPRICRGEAFF